MSPRKTIPSNSRSTMVKVMRLKTTGAVFAIALLTPMIVAPVDAQIVRDHNTANTRPLHGGARQITRSFRSDSEAITLFGEVLRAAGLAGLEDRIQLRASADTENAVAYIDGNERFIAYNALFMQKILEKDNDYWPLLAVLAHEIGHHVRFHTQIHGRNHEFELEADYQAGFILRRMGATLKQATALFKTFPAKATEWHPSRAERIQMVTVGWRDAVKTRPEIIETIPEQHPAPPVAAASSCATLSGTKFCVSSQLPTQGANKFHYGARNLIDGSDNTAWVEGRSKSGDNGIGEWIVASWLGEKRIAGIRVKNGYAKSAKLFLKNNRIRNITATLSNGKQEVFSFTDSPDWQNIMFEQAHAATWIKLEITQINAGEKYSDTALNELRIVFD